MTRQIDRGVLLGLALGLGFTFIVIFLFERGIPQRLLRPAPAVGVDAGTPAAADAAPPGGGDGGSGFLGELARISSPPTRANTPVGKPDGGLDLGAGGLQDTPNKVDKEAVPEAKTLWPLWALRTPRPATEVQLPPGSRVLSMDLDPRGEAVALVLALPGGGTALHLWRFENDLPAVLRSDGHSTGAGASTSPPGKVLEAVWSRFGSGLFVLLQSPGEWRVELLSPAVATAGGLPLGERRVLYRSKIRLGYLVSAGVRYDEQERFFFARQTGKTDWQILTSVADGSRVYEVTSPRGVLGDLTDAAIRATEPGDTDKRAHVLLMRSARPMSVNPFTGRLLFIDHLGVWHSLAYDLHNWAKKSDRLTVPASSELRDTPNGTFLLRLKRGGAGVELVESPTQAEATATLESAERFALLPVSAPTGRSIVGVVERGDHQALRVGAVPERLAYVRYFGNIGRGVRTSADDNRGPAIRAQVRERGLYIAPTDAEQLHEVYEGLEYSECGAEPLVPVFASIDGFLEVLAAGFQATFMTTEQLVSIPRLRRFLRELERVGHGQAGLARVAQIVAVSGRVLKGDYDHPEGKRILAEGSSESSLHTVPTAAPINFASFHPRGPYTATPALQHYFRAVRYLSELRLTLDEQRLLDGDAALRQSWRAWAETQSALLFDTRLPLLFDPDRALPAYVRAECVPGALRRHPRLLPLAFGIDSEIWHSVTAHESLPADCQVPGRLVPSGLDLLTALGSDEAQSIQSTEYSTTPALRDAHERLRRRFARPISAERVPESWLRLVQLLSTDRTVPEGVDPALWRRRLLQTALASWTNYRHTTVLLNEQISAECGGDGDPFEMLSREPLRGAVDPLPEGWEQLSRTLAMLAGHSGRLLPDQPDLVKLLQETAGRAHSFGGMAARQLRGVPLSPDEYHSIQFFSGQIEHPYVKFKTFLSQVQDAGLVKPEPTTKIVDIASAGRHVFHMAVGHPLQLVGLFADRGLLVPASGAVYSYHELLADKPLDDEAWRQRKEPPLYWTPQAQPGRAQGKSPATAGPH
jgi:hypothetical protein